MSKKPLCKKTLSAVEVDLGTSNQHELNGISVLKNALGLGRRVYPAEFSIFGGADKYSTEMTWYDAREGNPERSEHRFYFKTNPVMTAAKVGDVLHISLSGDTIFCELHKR